MKENRINTFRTTFPEDDNISNVSDVFIQKENFSPTSIKDQYLKTPSISEKLNNLCASE